MRPAAPIASPLHPEKLARFVDALPVPAIMKPSGTRADPQQGSRSLPYYRVAMSAIETQVHRDLQPTRCWAYNSSMPGPTFETRSGQGLWVEWHNELPKRHFLPIDHNLHGAGPGIPEVRAVVHVHGAKVPADSDGYPEHWITPGQSLLYHYPNRQDATMLWYHDHAMGIERLNQYAGLFGVWMIRDEVEEALKLPSDEYEVPLILCDRLFDHNGQLQYPTSGMEDAPWISELYGDTMMVNGKLFPFLDVEPRPYRLRIVNAANSRVFYLALSDGTPLQQIGTDQGLLAAPLALKSLTLAPAERADVIVDFSALAGQQLVLKSQAFELMQFRVAGRVHHVASPLPAKLRAVPPTPRSAASRTRRLTLNEYQEPDTHRMLMLLDGRYWHEPVSEKPTLGSVEIWEFVNLTGDTHPIHLHLVRFQLLERQAFDTDEYLTSGTMNLLGPPLPPLPEDAGWKDTIRAEPEMITRIIVRFKGYTGRYVWHCHILEHAANEMMRPFEVIASSRPEATRVAGKRTG